MCVDSEMNKGIEETKHHYQRMMFKEALRTGFFEFQVSLHLSLSYRVTDTCNNKCCKYYQRKNSDR